MTLTFNRREALALAAGAAGAVALGARPAAAKNDADEAIKKFTGGKTPVEGKVKLDLPEIAENGNTVPMTVTIESPMTEASHVTDVLVVFVSLGVASAILTEAGLSFLGLGIQPPAPSWGKMLNEAQTFMAAQPWLAIFPGAAIALTVLGFNLLGDGLRDALDPREAGR